MRCRCCVLWRHLLYIILNCILIACFCKQANLYCFLYIAEFLKTWPTKITAISLELGQTRVFISPKITEKRALEEGKGARAREKKTSNRL